MNQADGGHSTCTDTLLGQALNAAPKPRLPEVSTYLPIRRGFLYLVAITERAVVRHRSEDDASATRKVLAWRVSKTLHANFCIEALEGALAGYGLREIFNTDQGGQFISSRFTDVLKFVSTSPVSGGLTFVFTRLSAMLSRESGILTNQK